MDKIQSAEGALARLHENGVTRDDPWCRVGDIEINLARRYQYAGDLVSQAATQAAIK